MSQPLQGTIKPRRPTRLVATDLHWLWWLNVRSLNLLGQGLSEVPYLWPEGDGKSLRLYLEAVSEEEGMSVWSYTNPIDHAATIMVLLAKAEDEFPGFDPERPPETPMSPHLRWAVQRALEDHALRRIVCYPRVKSVSVQCELQGWDGRWFERSELYTRGVHHDAGLDLHAVALAGELPDLYMREGPLPDVLEWPKGGLGALGDACATSAPSARQPTRMQLIQSRARAAGSSSRSCCRNGGEGRRIDRQGNESPQQSATFSTPRSSHAWSLDLTSQEGGRLQSCA